MSDSATKSIREDIRYNSKNFGELGKFIRVEHVYNILDRYIINGRNANTELELGRIQEIQKILANAGAVTERELLQAIYQIVYP